MTPFESEVRRLRESGEFFSPDSPIFITRAPGRLDLMGGNDDYTGGLVFESTIREATWAAAQLRSDSQIVVFNPQMAEHGWQDRIEVDSGELVDATEVRALVNRSPDVRWAAYVLGIFHYLQTNWSDTSDRSYRGVSLFLRSEVPLNKGVSSSAAVEVASMKAASAAYGDPMSGIELAEACQWVENAIAQSACGIMDQITSVLGDEGYILPLVCQPCNPLPLVKLPEALQVWAIDSGVSHQVSGIEYEAARAAAFMGYKIICDHEGLPVHLDESARIPRFTDRRWNGYLANLSVAEYKRYEALLPERITGAAYLQDGGVHVDPFTTVRPEVTYRVKANTRYAVEENHRVEQFAQLAREWTDDEQRLASGEARDPGHPFPPEMRAYRMGDLMGRSHHAYTECGLGAEATDLILHLVHAEGAEHGLFGAKITGGGAGGTVAVLGLKTAGDAFRRVVSRYGEIQGFTPYVFEGSSAGADRFGVIRLEA